MSAHLARSCVLRLRFWSVLLSGLAMNLACAATPYPQLLSEIRADLLLELAPEPADDQSTQAQSEDEDEDEDDDRLQEWLVREIVDALLGKRVDRLQLLASGTPAAVLADPAAADGTEHRPRALALMLDVALYAEPLLDDRTLDWLQHALHTDRQLADRDGTLMLHSLRLGRALSERQPGHARQLLAAVLDQRARCLDAANPPPEPCEESTESPIMTAALEELSATLEGRQAFRREPPRRIHSQTPALGTVDCWKGPHYSRAMIPGWEMHAPDRVNLAVAFGDLDSAIAILLHEQILAPSALVDSRLRDLLETRHGKDGVQHELRMAEGRMERRQLATGAVLVTTLFDQQLQLPPGCPDADAPAATAPAMTATQSLQSADASRLLRQSALYQALQR